MWLSNTLLTLCGRWMFSCYFKGPLAMWDNWVSQVHTHHTEVAQLLTAPVHFSTQLSSQTKEMYFSTDFLHCSWVSTCCWMKSLFWVVPLRLVFIDWQLNKRKKTAFCECKINNCKAWIWKVLAFSYSTTDTQRALEYHYTLTPTPGRACGLTALPNEALGMGL